MIIGLLQVEILIPGSNSLKDKRSVLKRILFHIRKNYNVSVAETGLNDKWRRAELSFIIINSLKDPIERTLRLIVSNLHENPDIEVLFDRIEFL
ncbi:DUF503 domain-containing protein [Candidatus Sumerlaeota bacterium]|nr:DUF503 domain-containing protein [Candidatus Sumerlaeota bacterium]